MCNDAEERDHIKHLLLKYDYVLSVDVEGLRYFTKFAENNELDEFKYLKSIDSEKRAKIDQMRKEQLEHMEAEICRDGKCDMMQT